MGWEQAQTIKLAHIDQFSWRKCNLVMFSLYSKVSYVTQILKMYYMFQCAVSDVVFCYILQQKNVIEGLLSETVISNSC